MPTAPSSSTVIRHLKTLLFGVALAVVIWLAGSTDMSWLGFVGAAMYAERPSRRRRLGCLARRSSS